MDAGALAAAGPLLAHQARHASQFACAGLPMIPAYFAAAAWSWALTTDFGARNVFERRAGLADGGYLERPVRLALARWHQRLDALRSGLPPHIAAKSAGTPCWTPWATPRSTLKT
jgi:hypothetical protein